MLSHQTPASRPTSKSRQHYRQARQRLTWREVHRRLLTFVSLPFQVESEDLGLLNAAHIRRPRQLLHNIRRVCSQVLRGTARQLSIDRRLGRGGRRLRRRRRRHRYDGRYWRRRRQRAGKRRLQRPANGNML